MLHIYIYCVYVIYVYTYGHYPCFTKDVSMCTL